jgi:hypothetical protein
MARVGEGDDERVLAIPSGAEGLMRETIERGPLRVGGVSAGVLDGDRLGRGGNADRLRSRDRGAAPEAPEGRYREHQNYRAHEHTTLRHDKSERSRLSCERAPRRLGS